MGLSVSIHIRAHDLNRADIAVTVEGVFEHLRTVDRVFSTWRDDSDLMRLRRGAVEVSDAHPWIPEVHDLCAEATAATDGCFTTDLVGPDGSRGWDPTGLVKGWGVREAIRPLHHLRDVQFCANAGGDLICGGGWSSEFVDPLWRVGIEDPAHPQSINQVVQLTGGALATSGAGPRGRHIIDPLTSQPVQGDLTSISIVGPDLMWADVWATASFVDPGALAAQSCPRWSSYRVVGRTHDSS